MSAKTDDTLQSIQNIIAKGMPHKDEMYAVQGYCDMLAEAIAELEADIETLHTDLNTIVPELHNEIDRVKAERDKLRALLASKFSMDDKTKELCDIIKQDGIKPFICSTWPQEESNERTD